MLSERTDLVGASVMLTSCTSCGAALALECAPTQGFWRYRTYNEFMCAKCGKRNVALSPGAVISARLTETRTG